MEKKKGLEAKGTTERYKRGSKMVMGAGGLKS